MFLAERIIKKRTARIIPEDVFLQEHRHRPPRDASPQQLTGSSRNETTVGLAMFLAGTFRTSTNYDLVEPECVCSPRERKVFLQEHL